MNPTQSEYFGQLNSLQEHLSNSWIDYWQRYSSFGTWQFWVNVILIIGPLLILFFTIDRRKAFWIGFFGLNAHVWFHYIDSFGMSTGLWNYPYKAVPYFSGNVTLDAVLVPIALMLVYQWAVNHGKNKYLFLAITAALFAFVVKPIMVMIDLFEMYKWMNYFYLFLGYLAVVLVSIWLTDLFLWFERNARRD